jgi:hypothetical protein
VEESKLNSSNEKASVKMSREMQGEEKNEKPATEIRLDDAARYLQQLVPLRPQESVTTKRYV